MTSGLTLYNNGSIQFNSQYPALLVDRTNTYGYNNYILNIQNEPAQPSTPPTPPSGGKTSSQIYIKLFDIYHGLERYIPSFTSVTIGYGLGSSAGVNIWNEDAILSFNTNTLFPTTEVSNKLIFRMSKTTLYVDLVRTAVSYNQTGTVQTYYPPSLTGSQLDINVQIFAMGLDDISSIVI